MKIVHVITGLGTGGAETALCRLLESLKAPDFRHVVISLAGEGVESLDDWIAGLPAPVETCCIPAGDHFFRAGKCG